MSDPRAAIPQLPSTEGISDPQVRQFCEALRNAWSVRNGGGRDTERFVRAGEIRDIAAAAVVDTLSGTASLSTMSLQSTGGSSTSIYEKVAQAVNDIVTRSRVFEYLNTPVSQVKAPLEQMQQLQDRLDQEIEDRIAAIVAEAAARGSGITAEQTSRITADNNLQTQIDTIIATGTADTATILAALQAEQTARVAGDTAEATSRETLATQLRGSYTGTDLGALTEGLLYSERQARVSAIGAVATDVSSLIARMGTAEANIIAEQVARASADSSLASSITSLSSSIGASNAAIVAEETTRGNKDNSLAQAINTIWANIGGATALIQDGALAAVSPAAVTATKWSQVQAAVTDPNTGEVNAVSIKQELNAYASAANSTLNATWGVKVSVGGVISGVALVATSGAGSAQGATSQFAIMANRLSLVNPSNSGIWSTPFTVDGAGNAVFSGIVYAAGGVFSGSLSAATGTFSGSLSAATGTFAGSLTAQVVNTENIVGAAISTAYGTSSTGTSAGVTISIPAGARSLMVWAMFDTVSYWAYNGNPLDGYAASYVTIPASGSISSPLGSSSGVSCTALALLNPAAGTYTFTASRSWGPPASGYYYFETGPYWNGRVTLIALLTKR